MKSKIIKYIGIALAIILVAILIFIIYKQIDNFKLQKDPKLDELRNTFTQFFNNKKDWKPPLDMLNKRNVMSDINLYKGDKSYTINKEKVYLCLNDENSNYYSSNMLIYVLAHEISHVLSESVGHTEEFHNIFENLLVELTDAGIYDPTKPLPEKYCEYK